ncbi:cytochrome c1-2, heme protein, mitochondrial [Sorghum bicolor]|uniref:Cytochrome c domain-containing protein n=1 Tax=Sorghum bicolor TaxID=4558 RepID=C5XVT8_SORBI|nr:cytochrome c1-2, heme protein, mitochondrial [Sorghum bicolor]EES06001.1 hypothetical protein SORBI_3004G342100 [Sorghum bicolor]|eukprot:XP_002453025.1 cytochrome c1-2, heme protein, mitochondrial [Sorghum bicolor]
MAAAAMGLLRELLRTTGTRRLCGTAVGVAAGFLSAATVASASDGAACPAYPWSPQDGARGGHKVFMQHDCAACHSGLPYAGLADEALVAGGEVEAQAAEIVVVHDHEEAATALAATLHGGACPPDLSVITKMLEVLRHGDLYNNADEIKKPVALPSPVWLQFLQPYMRIPQAA